MIVKPRTIRRERAHGLGRLGVDVRAVKIGHETYEEQLSNVFD